MGVTLSTGPSVVSGPLGGTAQGLPPDPNIVAGPGITYQGDGIPDPRFFIPFSAERQGLIKAHADTPYFHLCNYIPSAYSASSIAAAQAAASGTPLTLATTASSGISPGTPMIPLVPGSSFVLATGIDLGLTKVVCVAANPVVTPATGTTYYFAQGQQVIIPNGLTATTALIATVIAVGATTITLSAAPGVSATLPICNGNVLDPLAFQVGAVSTGYDPHYTGGVGAFLNPLEGLTRGVSITGNASSTGGVFVIRGYDIYGQAMTQNVTHAGGATTIFTTKTFKFIASVTPQFTDAGHTYSVGTSDLFGFPVRTDFWEALNIFYNGAYQTVTTGWLAGDRTSPATATSGDVRGTYQLTTNGPGTGAGLTTPNGSTIRFSVYLSMSLQNIIQANPSFPDPMYGSTQV